VTWQAAVTTLRAGKNGLWVAKAGKDARTAAERDLLLATDYRNFSFMVNGIAILPAKAAPSVLYGTTLSNRPVPITQIIYLGQSLVPVYQLMNGRTPDSFLLIKSDSEYGPRGGPFGFVTALRDRLTFKSLKNTQYSVRFLVTSVKGYD
jgi:hypothetical protein